MATEKFNEKSSTSNASVVDLSGIIKEEKLEVLDALDGEVHSPELLLLEKGHRKIRKKGRSVSSVKRKRKHNKTVGVMTSIKHHENVDELAQNDEISTEEISRSSQSENTFEMSDDVNIEILDARQLVVPVLEDIKPVVSKDKIKLRKKIVDLHDKGLSCGKISKLLGITRATAAFWVKRWQSDRNLLTKQKKGRPKSTTPEEDLALLKAVSERDFISARQLTKELNLKCSHSTARRRLKNMGLDFTYAIHEQQAYRRQQIISMREEGKSMAAIAKELGTSRSTVNTWLKRWMNEGSLENKVNGYKATTEEQDEAIIKLALTREHVNLSQISKDLELTCSSSTLQRRLQKAGIFSIPLKKHYLPLADKEARIGFALQYSSCDDEFWKSCIFSDEKIFYSEQNGPFYCWKVQKTRFDRKNYFCSNLNKVRINLFAFMHEKGCSDLVKIDNALDSDNYIHILDNFLLPIVEILSAEHKVIRYFHNNYMLHSSPSVEEWFQTRENVEVIEFPMKSSDFNPVEDLWDIVSEEWVPISDNHPDIVFESALKIWDRIQKRHKLGSRTIDLLRRRFVECINTKGGWSASL